jgi:nitric oxide synthase oxygenase domain/subunit
MKITTFLVIYIYIKSKLFFYNYKICQRLGWKGRNGRFDVLPIVLSAPGEGVKFYEIPDELAVRVKIEHPTYSCFQELGLEWYAFPAISDMMLDCGGLQFTGAPFNGWYIGAEIGARNFCDPQRYDITEVYIMFFIINE